LEEIGFPLYTGPDDIYDQDLNNFVNEGLVDKPVMANGSYHLDGTIESAFVQLGKRGLGNVECGLVIEIPGGLTYAEKSQILTIIQNEFIVPFLEMNGLGL
jgi:hypothetical protein